MGRGSPTEEHSAYWEKVYREAPVNALKAIKEGAKQLVAITSALQGLYLFAISVDAIRAEITDWRIVLFTLPVIPWLICLGLAISVFVPESHYVTKKPDRIEAAFRATAKEKLRLLQWAQWILLTSMVLLFAEVILYLLWIPG
jgi:hypothetical protein